MVHWHVYCVGFCQLRLPYTVLCRCLRVSAVWSFVVSAFNNTVRVYVGCVGGLSQTCMAPKTAGSVVGGTAMGRRNCWWRSAAAGHSVPFSPTSVPPINCKWAIFSPRGLSLISKPQQSTDAGTSGGRISPVKTCPTDWGCGDRANVVLADGANPGSSSFSVSSPVPCPVPNSHAHFCRSTHLL